MTVADDLRYLVDVQYPEMVDNLNLMLSKLNEQLVLIQNEIITINDGVLDAAETAHLARLEALKISLGWAGYYTYGTYGIDNLNQWVMWVWNGSPVSSVTRNSDNGFTDNSSGVPNPVLSFVLPNGNTSLTRQIASATPGPPDPPLPAPPVPKTYVTYTLLPGPALPSPLNNIDFSNSPGYVDAELQDHEENFATGHNHLTKEIDLDGTYGLYPREDQIETGILVQTKNRDAYLKFIEDYEPYAA